MNYINRELSWLEFNYRVLEESKDRKNPLMEKLKFLAITSSNLDEFFMVRVASLWDQHNAGFKEKDELELSPLEQIEKITIRVNEMIQEQYRIYNKSLKSAMKKNTIEFLEYENLNKNQKKYIDDLYLENIYPVLTPMIVDNSRPFPLVLNKSLNIALILENKKDKNKNLFGTIQIPSVLKRFIKIPNNEKQTYILLEEIVKNHLSDLFSGHLIKTIGEYRITRNADLDVDEEGAEDLLEEIETSIKKRKWGNVVRIECKKNIENELLDKLIDNMQIPEEGIFKVEGPLDFTFLMKFYSEIEKENLKFQNFIPVVPAEFTKKRSCIDLIKEKDILLHHPYDSFEPILDFIKEAAEDKNVLAIKQTLYRVSGDSEIIKALERAAENGKQVTVLLEIKARFDEENNIHWAKRLEKSGCHVIYGLVGLKTHCKILLVVRKEKEGIVRYVHMGTGNYNDDTAKLYTDIGILTSNPYFGADISALFNRLTGYSEEHYFNKIEISPGLDQIFIKNIENEIELKKQGKKAKIIAKMNALVEKSIIDKLYEASEAGVEIDLIIRGICCLIPGVKGLSENIKIISIVGRFLEHSRIFYFFNDREEKIYLSSADWMPRNLKRRVELLFPVENIENKKIVKEILKSGLKDNVKSRKMNSNGTYQKIFKNSNQDFNSQMYFYEKAVKKRKKDLTISGESLKIIPILTEEK